MVRDEGSTRPSSPATGISSLVPRRALLRGAVASALAPMLCAVPRSAAAQPAGLPSGVVRIIVPFAPGGATDIVARAVGNKLSKLVGKSVVVENRTGAGLLVGSDFVFRQPDDGMTLLFVSSGKLINRYIYKTMSFDPMKDFSTLALVSETPLVFLVPPSTGVKDLASLRKLLVSQPGEHAYGSAGVGVAGHMTAAAFSQMIGAQTRHVPYRGESAALVDLISGRLTFEAATVTAAMPFIEAGSLIPLAVTHETRVPQIPNVPSMSEAGMPELGTILYTAWNAIDIRSTTSPGIQAYWSSSISEVLQDPEIRNDFTRLGLVSMPIRDLDETNALMQDLGARIGPVVKASGAVAQ